jgi:hypothetical protein
MHLRRFTTSRETKEGGEEREGEQSERDVLTFAFPCFRQTDLFRCARSSTCTVSTKESCLHTIEPVDGKADVKVVLPQGIAERRVGNTGFFLRSHFRTDGFQSMAHCRYILVVNKVPRCGIMRRYLRLRVKEPPLPHTRSHRPRRDAHLEYRSVVIRRAMGRGHTMNVHVTDIAMAGHGSRSVLGLGGIRSSGSSLRWPKSRGQVHKLQSKAGNSGSDVAWTHRRPSAQQALGDLKNADYIHGLP